MGKQRTRAVFHTLKEIYDDEELFQRFIEQLPYDPGNQAKQDLWQALSITSKMSSKEDYQERVKRLHDWEEHVKKKFTREIRDRFLLKRLPGLQSAK